MGNAAVQQTEAFAHDGVARSREPTHLMFGQAGHVSAQGVVGDRFVGGVTVNTMSSSLRIDQLRSRKAPLEMLIIDKIEKVPTEN